MASNRPRVRLAFVGCGGVAASRHLPALRTLPAANVVALSDVDSARLTLVAEKFRVSRRHSDYRSLLDDPDIDAVAVCVPPQFHAEIALAVLDAGKHLFVEKPLALTLEDSQRLLDRAGQSDRKAMIGFNLRWHRHIRRARTLLEQGIVGRPELMRTVMTSRMRTQPVPGWKHRRATGGGLLVEVAVHHVDLWRYLLGSEVEEIFAISRSGRRDDESAALTARMANGALATSVHTDSTAESNEVDIYGALGRLHVSCYQIDGLAFTPATSLPGNLRGRLRGTARFIAAVAGGLPTIRAGGDFVASYRAEWQHFINAIVRDEPIESTLRDGHRALQAVLGAAESVSTGHHVKLAAARLAVPVGSLD